MHNEEVEKDLQLLGLEWRQIAPEALRLRVAALSHRAAELRQGDEAGDRVVNWWASMRATVGVTIAIVLLLLAVPASRHAIARQAHLIVQALRIGPRTQLVTFGPQTANEVREDLRQFRRDLRAGTAWEVSTAYGGFAGSVPANASPDVQRIERLDDLRALATIPLEAPEGMYRGAPLVFHHALVAPGGGFVLAFFGTGDREVLLVQANVADGHQISFSRALFGPNDRVVKAPPMAETMTIDGQQVTWDPDSTGVNLNLSALRWEKAGISYSLCGRALSKEEASAVFSSLRPLGATPFPSTK
jgi:hypothetical protein